jgi:siderophore synthetase component
VKRKTTNPLHPTLDWLRYRCQEPERFDELVLNSFLYSLSRFVSACLRERVITKFTWRKYLEPSGSAKPTLESQLLILRGNRGHISCTTGVSRNLLHLHILKTPELFIDGSKKKLLDAKHFFAALRSIGLCEKPYLVDAQALFENSQAHFLIALWRNHLRASTYKTLSFGNDSSYYEKLCIGGHSLYPFPKLREQFSLRDSLLYSNERRGLLPLPLLALPKELSLFSSLEYESSYDFYRTELKPIAKGTAIEKSVSDYNLIPIHPWQMRNVPFIRNLLKKKNVLQLPTSLCGKALVSLRTLYVPSCDLDVKVSLSATITSEKRVIYQFQSQNAPLISRILEKLISFQKVDRLKIQKDLASVRYANFKQGPEITAIFRRHVSNIESLEIIPATYLYDETISPDYVPAIVRLIELYESVWHKSHRDFFRQYARVVLGGPFSLLWCGIGLEPHLQNSLIGFKNYKPSILILRDTDAANIVPQKISEYISLSDYPWYQHTWDLMQPETFSFGRFWHAAIRSHLGSLINAIARHFQESEECMWLELRAVLEEALDKGSKQSAVDGGARAALIANYFFRKYELIKCVLRMKASDSERFIFKKQTNPLWRGI